LCAALSDAAQNQYINLTTIVPESMDYDSAFGYITGSVFTGNTWKVDPVSGVVTSLAMSPNMTSTFGIQVDTRGGRHRLLVCSGVFPVTSVAGVAVIDLTQSPARQTAYYDLSRVGNPAALRLCNDLVSDNAGNIYATDSMGGQVFKISTTGVVSSYVVNPGWLPTSSMFGTDGIELTPDGNLIVGHIANYANDSTMWLVTVANTPTYVQMTITGGAVTGVDGIYMGPLGCLYIAGAGFVKRLISTDGWRTATILESVASPCTTPTAVAFNSVAGQYFVSCANNFGQTGGPAAIASLPFTTETATMCTSSSSRLVVSVALVICMMILSLHL